MRFQGLSAFPITPADADGKVIPGDLRRIVRRSADAGVDSVCVLGSTGGFAYLDPISAASPWTRPWPNWAVACA